MTKSVVSSKSVISITIGSEGRSGRRNIRLSANITNPKHERYAPGRREKTTFKSWIQSYERILPPCRDKERKKEKARKGSA